MSLSMISFIIQCCSVGVAGLIYACYLVKNIKLKLKAKKTIRAIENQKKKKELYLSLKKEFEGDLDNGK